jgi:hypothetical protein
MSGDEPASEARPPDDGRDAVAGGLVILLPLAVALWAWWTYVDQPILENHAFRQTQTAITSYWMAHDGFRFDYQTPVAGAPWSIPLEFPLYQSLVAAASRGFGTSLDATGRTLSFVFFLASLIPAALIVRRLNLPRRVFFAFAALYLSSPLYLFWGRTFMIETTATCLTLFALAFGLDVVRRQAGWATVLAASAFATLALLQKVTTAAPAIGLLGVGWLVHGGSRRGEGARWAPREWLKAALAWGLPLAVAAGWNSYTDAVKVKNAFGPLLMAANMHHWNFGSLEQRVSKELWLEVVLARGVYLNTGRGLGAFVVLAALTWRSTARTRGLIAACLVAYLAALLVFTNLHIVHDYYQVACTVFLIAAVAVAIGYWLPAAVRLPQAWAAVLLPVVLVNLHLFRRRYERPMMHRAVSPAAGQTLALAAEIERRVPEGEPILVYGYEWSSEIAYYSRRKSFTVPSIFPRHDETLRDPARFLGGRPPAAVLVCPRDHAPSLAEVDRTLPERGRYDAFETQGCTLLIRRRDA